MSAARICLVVAAILGLNACLGRHDIPPSPPTSTSQVPEPTATAVTPAPPQPARATVPGSSVTTPAPQAASKVAPPVVKTPAAIARAPVPAAPPAVSLTLDFNALKNQLKETKAIGLFSKIALKNQIDDLLDQFRKYYQGKAKIDMTGLRRSYNLLMMKVLSLLQDEDQKLASAIVAAREAIWDLLADPKKFATLEI